MKDTDIPAAVRHEVLARDSYDGCPCCTYCGSSYNLHLHHVKRRSQGGKGQPENLITLCFSCHARLHTGDLEIRRFTEDYLRGKYGGELDVYEHEL